MTTEETPAVEETPETPAVEEPVEEPFDKDRAMATIHKLREDVKAARADARKAKELETRLKELEDAQKTDEQKRVERLAELEKTQTEIAAREQDLRLKLAVYQNVSAAGIADADIAYALIDRSQVEFDDTGDPSNLTDVLKALAEAKPILKGGQAGQQVQELGNTDATAGQRNAAPALTADELEAAQKSGMTPEEYAAFKNVSTYEDYKRAREALEKSRQGNAAGETPNAAGRVHIATTN